MSGVLEPLGGEDLDQVAHVQAGRGRVEAHVEADAALGQRLAQGVEVGRVGDEAAPLEVVEDVGTWVTLGLPWAGGRGQACLIAVRSTYRVPREDFGTRRTATARDGRSGAR